jgi:hypothetical protein
LFEAIARHDPEAGRLKTLELLDCVECEIRALLAASPDGLEV